jgi:hypothetical protein
MGWQKTDIYTHQPMVDVLLYLEAVFIMYLGGYTSFKSNNLVA